MILLVPAALAHPVGGRFAARTVDIHLGEDVLAVSVRVDVPVALVKDRVLDGAELAAGLRWTVDDAVGPWQVEGPLPSGDDAVAWSLRSELPAPSGAFDVSLGDANLPDAASLSRVVVQGHPRWSVRDAGPLRHEGVDRSGSWWPTERLRDLKLEVAPVDPTLRAGRWLAGDGDWAGLGVHGSPWLPVRAALSAVTALASRRDVAAAATLLVAAATLAPRAAALCLVLAFVARRSPLRVANGAAALVCATAVTAAVWLG